MIKRKSTKSHGKLSFSRYFQEFKEGDKVAVVREQSLNPSFPERIQGKNGKIVGKRGNAYVLKLMDGNEEKVYIMAPMHLRRMA